MKTFEEKENECYLNVKQSWLDRKDKQDLVNTDQITGSVF